MPYASYPCMLHVDTPHLCCPNLVQVQHPWVLHGLPDRHPYAFGPAEAPCGLHPPHCCWGHHDRAAGGSSTSGRSCRRATGRRPPLNWLNWPVRSVGQPTWLASGEDETLCPDLHSISPILFAATTAGSHRNTAACRVACSLPHQMRVFLLCALPMPPQGTAFLAADEAGTSQAGRELLQEPDRGTLVTQVRGVPVRPSLVSTAQLAHGEAPCQDEGCGQLGMVATGDICGNIASAGRHSACSARTTILCRTACRLHGAHWA
jgi:hypothetical protein